MIRLKTILLVFLLIGSVVSAQNSGPLFRHFTAQEGLPSSQVYQILQDSSHYLWFATDHGLARYNGYEFKRYTSADGLEDNTVLKLFLDHRKRVWLQTLSGKLYYLKNDRIVPYQFNELVASLVKNNIPLNFYLDSMENLWFSVSSNGEYLIDAKGKLITALKIYRNRNFNQIFFDEFENNHFVTSSNSIYNIEYPSWLYYAEKHQPYDSLFIGKSQDAQLFCRRLARGKLLISISNHIYDFEKVNLVLLDSVASPITNIYEDQQENLWVSTFSGIYFYSHSVGFKNPHHYLKNEYITGSFQDHEGGIWVSTLNNGIFYLNNFQIKSYLFLGEQLIDPVCLSADKHTIYAGFWDGGLVRLNSDHIITTQQFNEKYYISSLFYDTLTSRLFIGKNPPGYLENQKFVPFRYSITRSLKGNYIRRRNGDLLNVTANGLYIISGDSVKIHFSLEKRSNCIFEDSKNNLLVGCNNGAFIVDKATNATTLIHPSLAGVRVDDIREFNGMLCFATRGSGLKILKDTTMYTLGESDGLCNNIIHRLAVSKKYIWCASFNGLSRVGFSNQETFKFFIDNIGYLEGIPDNEINDLVVLNDTVWVASRTAISFFSQQTDFRNAVPPVMYFTNMIVNNHDSIFEENVELPYNSNNISIGFEALSFKSAGIIKYRYRLVHEADIFQSVTTNRHVEFLSLKPGNYNFIVEAQNSSGLWSKQPVSWQFVIHVPWWQQWWFKIVVSIILLCGIYLFIKQRIGRIRKEEALKTDFNKQLVQLEMKALRAQMNPHFIFNVINSIQDYILQNDAKSAQRYLTKFARLVRSILNNSVEGEVILLDEIKANELYVELEQQRFEEQFDFVLKVDPEVEADQIIIPSMIIQPFLENSIKHGIRHLKTKGLLSLEINQSEYLLVIAIEDNGVGRTKALELNKMIEQEHVSYGSLITSRRVAAYNQAHNTRIELVISDLYDVQNRASGTRVVLTIPLKFKK
ncbi:histidine kinase [soil metagenome]